MAVLALATGIALGQHYRLSRKVDRISETLIDYWSRRQRQEGQVAVEAAEEVK